MKSNVDYSRFSILLTYGVIALIYCCCIASLHQPVAFFSLLSVLIILVVTSLIYAPWFLKVDSDDIILGSLLKKHKIHLNDIETIELFQPTMAAMRIFGSGGFMGYWGLFRESDIGKYRAFYGKASDCFLICLKNGQKYVVGCKNPRAMVDLIKSQLS